MTSSQQTMSRQQLAHSTIGRTTQDTRYTLKKYNQTLHSVSVMLPTPPV